MWDLYPLLHLLHDLFTVFGSHFTFDPNTNWTEMCVNVHLKHKDRHVTEVDAQSYQPRLPVCLLSAHGQPSTSSFTKAVK